MIELRSIWIVAAVGVVASCGPGAVRPAPPGNVAVTDTVAVHVSATDPLGWLGLVPARHGQDDHPGWVPVAVLAAAVVPEPGAANLGTGTDVTVVPAHGAPVPATVLERTRIDYGCDQNQLDVLKLDGEPGTPGVAWIPPVPAPGGWAPAGVAVVETHADPAHRSWTVGAVQIDVTRIDDMHARLVIASAGAVLVTRDAEKAMMDGAVPAPIDLTTEVPGIPAAPVAAFAIAPAGPMLIVMLVPGYEGVTLATWLIDGTRAPATAVEVGSLSEYLYYCAF